MPHASPLSPLPPPLLSLLPPPASPSPQPLQHSPYSSTPSVPAAPWSYLWSFPLPYLSGRSQWIARFSFLALTSLQLVSTPIPKQKQLQIQLPRPGQRVTSVSISVCETEGLQSLSFLSARHLKDDTYMFHLLQRILTTGNQNPPISKDPNSLVSLINSVLVFFFFFKPFPHQG